jgi:5-methylcytosine-specific restriction endonuclease McrA
VTSIEDFKQDGGMGARPQEFTRRTQELALLRQGNLCASCGTLIAQIGKGGRSQHTFGEGAQAHHVKHVKFAGTNHVDNCVVICDSCHYSVHEGGNYRFGTVMGTPNDFPYYRVSDQASES